MQRSVMKATDVLYQIYGRHHLYGGNVLLYIGLTSTAGKRLTGHEKDWIYYEYDPVTVRFGSVRQFTDWKEQEKNKRFIKDRKLIQRIESLLIFAHLPADNNMNKKDIPKRSEGIRIFNSGRLGSLYPELSYKCFNVGR